MRSRAVAATLLVSLAAPAASADPAFDRVVDTAKTSAIISEDVVEKARSACTTALCFAEALATEIPDRVRLEPVTHPDTDSIRWVKTKPSVIADGTELTLTLKITHFGRKAVAELREALTNVEEDQRVQLDVRANPGGDFERMLDIAGLLIGSRRDVVEIDYGDHIERRSLKGPRSRPWRVTHVLVDEQTASAALLLARLLETYADADVKGPPTQKNPVFLKRRLPIDHDWRLVLPIAEVRVPAP